MNQDPLKTDNISAEVKHLGELVRGLMYISETDAPIEAFEMHDPGDRTIADALAKLTKGKKIEVVEPDKFFSRLTAAREWHSEDDTERAERFRKLFEYLSTSVTDLNVYKTGEVQIDIYIVGRSPHKTILGVKTRSVET